MPDPIAVNEGDIAFAWQVQQLSDIFMGIRPFNPRFTAWSHPTTATLRVANRTAGGPIAEFLTHNLDQTVLLIDESGIKQANVGGWLDWENLGADPSSPAVGSNDVRMYAKGNQMWFRFPGSAPQQIPIGPPPGPSLRYAFWMS